MSLKIKVKVNHISNLSDARYCAGMGVQYLGFNFIEREEYYIDPVKYNEIKTWVSGPEFVGEFANADTRYINKMLSHVSIDIIETCHIEILNQLVLLGKPIFLKLDLARYPSQKELSEDLNFAKEIVELFILENTSVENIVPDFIKDLTSSYKLLLGFGIDQKKIERILDKTGVYGITLQGGKEEQVGFKDYDELADILEIIEVE